MISDVSDQLVPCAVVVDHRNLVGQARRVFGRPHTLSLPGLGVALARYGLRPVDVRVGMATRVLQEKCSNQVHSMLGRNRELAEQYRQGGAQVLEGYLVERAKGPEEKQVDVLCALAVADIADRIQDGSAEARCIVTLSEDADFVPSYDFAATRGVSVYAASVDRVHERSLTSWILLDEVAMADITPPGGRFRGKELRAWIAKVSLEGSQIAGQWAAGYRSGAAVEMVRNNGAVGSWVPGRAVNRGEKVSLYANGVRPDPTNESFPNLVLAEEPVDGTFPGVVEGTVSYWTHQTRVRVELEGGQVFASWAPPGSYLPGQRVAVQTSGSRPFLVGELEKPAVPTSWQGSRSLRTLVQVVRSAGPAWVIGRDLASGQEVALARKNYEPAVGDIVYAVLVGEHPTWELPTLFPLTTSLQQKLSI
ncbi:hypothetical protein [Tessaracoccus flavescens]|uniref:hypothetical protein n=1 Tax=Tessaracoccus flavescens TaxID=399497 RepID=UPI00126015DA|nr:hypothetical protein [Tessaracoccus flavescens]